MPSTTILETLETLSRFDPGIDWGGARRVLARTTDRRTMLFVVQGHTAPIGARGFGRQYHRASLVLYSATSRHGHAGHSTDDLGEGRLDLLRVRRAHGALIERVFACEGLANMLVPNKTIVVTRE